MNANAYAIQIIKTNQTYINTNEIFDYIAKHTKRIDIQIHFAKDPQREPRLDDLILSQLIHSPSYTSYIQDLYAISMNKKSKPL